MIIPSTTIAFILIPGHNHLLKYESHLREAENDIRRQARAALALEGRIASESEIRKWREANADKVEGAGTAAGTGARAEGDPSGVPKTQSLAEVLAQR
ncbi:hypothetical protein I316_00966 [Kwoniella heveanensis BCC8398]|uniref:Uncharacterized protein n=1 Tax=Kwoniella heveanensis BCC8398 TaxID=1296120 RepID=A0A1B9H1A7_9TREE|nr:hypothetical protein I316_00966 [Kwoniella heveanensis BCC8398]